MKWFSKQLEIYQGIDYKESQLVNMVILFSVSVKSRDKVEMSH